MRKVAFQPAPWSISSWMVQLVNNLQIRPTLSYHEECVASAEVEDQSPLYPDPSLNLYEYLTVRCCVKMTEQKNNRFYEKRFIAREWFVRTGKPLMTAINEYVKSKEENALTGMSLPWITHRGSTTMTLGEQSMQKEGAKLLPLAISLDLPLYHIP